MGFISLSSRDHDPQFSCRPTSHGCVGRTGDRLRVQPTSFLPQGSCSYFSYLSYLDVSFSSCVSITDLQAQGPWSFPKDTQTWIFPVSSLVHNQSSIPPRQKHHLRSPWLPKGVTHLLERVPENVPKGLRRHTLRLPCQLQEDGGHSLSKFYKERVSYFYAWLL